MLARLEDGTRVAIRPIRPSDKLGLVASRELFSDETMRRRFLSPKPMLSRAELRYLTEVDGDSHYALVAAPLDRLDLIVAAARFVRLPEDPSTAEAAIVVADSYQRAGLGRRLALMLADAARERGVRRFTATMLSDNPAALRLMQTLSRRLEYGPHDHGTRAVVSELAA
ncbi:MAG TPA: GNAT family N-acetyltransferase [Thermoleophilaceae bacterium]|jgi:GNAT superfamily N-acetyltransferase